MGKEFTVVESGSLQLTPVHQVLWFTDCQRVTAPQVWQLGWNVGLLWEEGPGWDSLRL